MAKELESLPNAKVGQIEDLVKKLSLLGGSSDREGLAYAVGIKKASIYNPLKAAEILGFVDVEGDQIEISETGNKFASADEKDKKSIFHEQVTSIEPFTTISRALEQAKEMDETLVLRLVKAKIKAARKWKTSTDKEMLRMIINWAEYAELFEFDVESKMFHAKHTGGTE